jgi:hypothetical protein
MALINLCNTGKETSDLIPDSTTPTGGTVALIHDGDADTCMYGYTGSGAGYHIHTMNAEIEFNQKAVIEEVKVKHSLVASRGNSRSYSYQVWLFYDGSETSIDSYSGSGNTGTVVRSKEGLWSGVSKIRVRLSATATGYSVPYSYVRATCGYFCYEVEAWGALLGGRRRLLLTRR